LSGAPSLPVWMTSSGRIPRDSRLISGLKTLTAAHMLRSVLGKTPGFCSSMKLAELSNPLIPSIAEANPRNSARASPPRLMSPTVDQLSTNTVGSSTSAATLISASTVSVSRWTTKIPSATIADSVIPSRLRNAKNPSSAMVATKTSIPCQRWCAYSIASPALITAVAT